MSYIAFLLLMSVFALSFVFSTKNIEIEDIASQDILSDRIYYKFKTIQDSVIDILEKEFNSTYLTLNVSVDEQPDFSYVEFQEKLPQTVSNFIEDLARYENFTEEYLTEKNIDVDTDIANIGNTMTLIIEPYNISYTHEQGFGKRQYAIIPEDNENSSGKINAYNITVQLLDGWQIESGQWGPLKNDGLKTTITFIDDSSSYTTTEYLSKTQKSNFKMDVTKDTFEGWVRIRVADTEPASLRLEMHLCEAIVTTELNLTDIPGKTKVDLLEGQINVIENLYNIQKNDLISVI